MANKDYNQIKYLLQDILQYPSTDLADLHRDSNRLGTLDIIQNQQQLKNILSTKQQTQIHCQCCGFLLQPAQIPLSTSIKSIPNMGISTYLYFQTISTLTILLSILFTVYSRFAIVTNIIAFNNYNKKQLIPINYNFITFSLSSKQLDQTQDNMKYYYIQCWIGLAIVILWCIVFIIRKYYQRNDQILIENKTLSVADFSVVIEGVPTTMKLHDFQKQIDQYYNKLTQDKKIKQIDRPFKIAKWNLAIPFYLTMNSVTQNTLKKSIQDKQNQRNIFIEWILMRRQYDYFTVPELVRNQAYKKYRNLQDKIQRRYKNSVQKIAEQKRKNNIEPTTYAYVTFQSTYARQLICYLNCPDDKLVRTQRNLSCCQNNSLFTINFQTQKYRTIIKKAPQPQDIIWTNIGQSLTQMILRKLLTYSITATILGGTFVIIYFLTKQQVKNNQDYFLSFIISILISIINLIIPFIIRILTNIQRQVTQTKFQTGLALKSIIAQLINSILLPFFINLFIQQNIYQAEGLAYDTFTMAITNSFMAPILKIFNIGYFISKLTNWYYKRPLSRLNITQNQLNNINNLSPFQIGLQYIYPVNVYLFTCFFVSLQPIIAIFGLLGLICMYWVQKYMLFNRHRRPFPGNDLVNTAMYQVIYFGPLVFSLGNLTWSNLLADGGPKTALVPNLIAVGLSTVFAALPYKIFFLTLISKKYGKQMLYSQNRIYLPSQYDRLNPATAKQAMVEYYKFIRQYKQQINQFSQQQLLKLSKLIQLQKQRGTSQTPQILKLFNTFDLITVQKQAHKSNNKSQIGEILNKQQKIGQKLEKIEQKDEQKIIRIQQKKEQQDSSDNDEKQKIKNQMATEEKIITIKQDGIKQQTEQNKSKEKKILTAQNLFKSFGLGQKNVIKFQQNWTAQQQQIQSGGKKDKKQKKQIGKQKKDAQLVQKDEQNESEKGKNDKFVKEIQIKQKKKLPQLKRQNKNDIELTKQQKQKQTNKNKSQQQKRHLTYKALKKMMEDQQKAAKQQKKRQQKKRKQQQRKKKKQQKNKNESQLQQAQKSEHESSAVKIKGTEPQKQFKSPLKVISKIEQNQNYRQSQKDQNIQN